MNEQFAVRKAVGIWIRLSTENQAKGDSPEHHEKRARCYAESKGWEVIEVYHLEAVSGKSVIDHPEAKRMLGDVRNGRISGLIFSKLARLARNTKELLEFSDIFRGLNADLISLQESIDTSTPAGRLFYTMIAAMAQWEREEIAERINASVAVRAKLGKPLSGQAPFGYTWIDKKLVLDPKEVPIRRLMYELFLEHRRKKTVARLLNEAGHRTRNGSTFSDTTVGRLLEDPIAKGIRRSNYTKNMAAGGAWKLKPETEWVWHEAEPIVTEDVWERCNTILKSLRPTRRPGKRPVNLFSGLTYCHCGTKMYVPWKTGKYICQKCRNKIPVMDLEGIFRDQLKGFFLSPRDVDAHLQKADEHLKQKESLLAVMEAEVDRLKHEIDRIYRLYVDQQISSEAFGKFFKPLEQRQKQLDDEFPRLQGEIDAMKINNISSDQVLTEAKNLNDRWSSLNRDEKQRVVESVTESIVIGKDEIAINLCHLPSSEELTKWQCALWGSSRLPT